MNKTAVIIKALHAGIPVVLDGYNLVADEEGEIWITGLSHREGDIQGVTFLRYDIPINHFIRACESLSDEVISTINMNLVLNNMKG